MLLARVAETVNGKNDEEHKREDIADEIGGFLYLCRVEADDEFHAQMLFIVHADGDAHEHHPGEDVAADLFDPGDAATEQVSRNDVDEEDREQNRKGKCRKEVESLEDCIAQLLQCFVERIHGRAPFESS